MKKYLIFFISIIVLAGCQSKENSENHLEVSNINPVEDEGDEWTSIILKEGELITDLNADGCDDVIKISYKNIEGSNCISNFEIIIMGDSSVYSIKNYDASFEKLERMDIDKDGVEDIIFLFDTHGSGGQGTHDIFLFNHSSLKKLSSSLDINEELKAENNVDDIYFMEKIIYNEEERLLVRQYLYGEEGHADGKGDMVSIVSFDSSTDAFIKELSWLEGL